MISVCIPTYNYNVNQLVGDLVFQAEKLNIEIEIIVADDASNNKDILYENREVKKLKNVHLLELEANIGRAAIRNFMAEDAHFDNLVFIDADSLIPDNFIKKYLDCTDKQITIGGTVYGSKPLDQEKYLRWFYGINREMISAKTRNLNPHKSFTANNFMINKSLFLSIRFDEKLKKYGHEDTVFGYELKKRNISIHHIDNPVEHIGLESSIIFVQKTMVAIENLCLLYEKNKTNRSFIDDNKLLLILSKLDKKPFNQVITKILTSLKTLMLKNILSRKPKLYIFDLLKLAYILEIYARNRKSNIN